MLVILLQRTSQDGLAGLGGGSSNPAGMVQVRGSANLLTKMTSFLAVSFIMTSLSLAYIANQKDVSVADKIQVQEDATKPVIVEPEVPLAE